MTTVTYHAVLNGVNASLLSARRLEISYGAAAPDRVGVESRRGKAPNDLGGATRIQHPVMLTIIRIFLAYWFGFSILFMILSLVMVGPVSIYNTVGLGFLAAIILTLIQRWRR